jgi:hypothetical protein
MLYTVQNQQIKDLGRLFYLNDTCVNQGNQILTFEGYF